MILGEKQRFSRLDYTKTAALAWFAIWVMLTLASTPAAEAADTTAEENPSFRTVQLSFKWFLNARDERTEGAFQTNDQIIEAISGANTFLENSGATWRLALDEIVDLDQHDEWWRMSCNAITDLELAAEAAPTEYAWRTDAVNLYIAGDLTGRCDGKCSFPDSEGHNDVIILQNNEIPLEATSYILLHELGHYFNLYHTYETNPLVECQQPADDSECTGAGGGGYTGPHLCCTDTCPSWNNIMGRGKNWKNSDYLSPCQLDIVESAMIGVRRDVTMVPLRRGDVNNDSHVDLFDADYILEWYLLGRVPAPSCMEAADANDDGRVGVWDALAVLEHVLLGKPTLGGAGDECGVEPTPGRTYLGCASSACAL